MAMRVLKIRRVMIGIGATDEQADEFVELMDGFVTTDYLDAQLAKLFNRMLLAGIGFTAINIGAMALLTRL